MGNQYKHGDRVPTDKLANRLDELADAVTKGKTSIDREFTMRIPAELDRCPDLVMSQAAERMRILEKALLIFKQADIENYAGSGSFALNENDRKIIQAALGYNAQAEAR